MVYEKSIVRLKIGKSIFLFLPLNSLLSNLKLILTKLISSIKSTKNKY